MAAITASVPLPNSKKRHEVEAVAGRDKKRQRRAEDDKMETALPKITTIPASSVSLDLRAAFLKTRFADIIVKANPHLERQPLKSAFKMQIQKEREAARIALENIEKTVDVEDNLQVMRDFENLLNCAF